MKQQISFTILALSIPMMLNAESNFLEYKLPSMVKSIAEGAETGSAGVAAREEVRKFSLDVANSGLNLLEDELVSGTGFTHLELSLGSDVFGLDSGTKTKSELMAVYGLYEDDNLFLFNQTSVVNFDSRSTFNIGLGARHITDDESLIVGANAFYDYESKSGHKRSSLGFELLTAMLEFRANTHNGAVKRMRTRIVLLPHPKSTRSIIDVIQRVQGRGSA